MQEKLENKMFLPSSAWMFAESKCWRPVCRLFSITARLSSSWRLNDRAASCWRRMLISSPAIGPMASNTASSAITHSASSLSEISNAFQWSELFSNRFLQEQKNYRTSQGPLITDGRNTLILFYKQHIKKTNWTFSDFIQLLLIFLPSFRWKKPIVAA